MAKMATDFEHPTVGCRHLEDALLWAIFVQKLRSELLNSVPAARTVQRSGFVFLLDIKRCICSVPIEIVWGGQFFGNAISKQIHHIGAALHHVQLTGERFDFGFKVFGDTTGLMFPATLEHPVLTGKGKFKNTLPK
jgi:hypothetical protein